MNYKINRPVKIREAGTIIQSQLFWLGASLDGVIFDKKIQEMGLLEIRCPHNKRAMGLAGLKWCHFVVYVYSGMIIVKVDFDRYYFQSVID